MKKILFLAISIGIFCFGTVRAMDTDVWLSSNTTTADTTQNLCKPTTSYLIGTSTFTAGNHGIIHGACINQGAAGTLTVYNSSGSATNSIFALATSTPIPCNYYDVAVSSGLTYTNSGTANITLLYNCY